MTFFRILPSISAPHYLIAVLLISGLSSCVKHRELINFANVGEGALDDQSGFNSQMVAVKPEDLLRITVSSFDQAASAPFNIETEGQGGRQSGGNQGLEQLELFSGYFVDQNGYIDFPVIGRVLVADKTLEEIREELTNQIRPYLTDAVVNVRFLNFKVTVLGEVNLPGTIRLTNRRVTILDAIGYAGDLTLYANRSNVLVIRETDGKKITSRLNLHANDFLSSPFYYLEQNDVIYVEPLEVRTATVADPAQRLISYGGAALSFITLIIALTVK